MPHVEGWAIIESKRGHGYVLTADSVTGHEVLEDGSPITETSTNVKKMGKPIINFIKPN